MSVGAAHRDRTERWSKERLLFGTPVSLAKMISKNRLTLPRGIAASIGPAEYFDVEAGDGQIILADSVAVTRLCQADAGTDAPKKMSDLLRKMLKRLHPGRGDAGVRALVRGVPAEPAQAHGWPELAYGRDLRQGRWSMEIPLPRGRQGRPDDRLPAARAPRLIETMHMIEKGQLDAIKDRASSAANQLHSLAS